jgi:uncharacterized membrane protein YidH (DUF202 family)
MTDALSPKKQLTPEELARKKAKKDKKEKQKKLDQEKTFLAFDRTLLAWIRTGTSLLTFGFAIMKLLQEEALKPGQHPVLQLVNPMVVGWTMILSGFIGLTMAVANYVKFGRQFGRKPAQIFVSPTMIVSYVLIFLCFAILTAPLMRRMLIP